MEPFERARQFIYRNARPLELARWQYHFENGTREAVLQALQVYQNEDGGFGHALEPDNWNPNSTPIATWEACNILRELNCLHSSNPIVEGIINYLSSGKDFSEGKWFNQVSSTSSYPHAIWWESSVDVPADNPTVSLAGFAINVADRVLYSKAEAIIQTAVDSFLEEPTSEMHTLVVFLEMLNYCKEANYQPVIGNANFQEVLFQQIRQTVSKDPEEWFASYASKPSNYFYTKEQLLTIFDEKRCLQEVDNLIKHQQEDGSFAVPWQWGTDYPEFFISKQWWKSILIIKNFLFLRAFSK